LPNQFLGSFANKKHAEFPGVVWELFPAFFPEKKSKIEVRNPEKFPGKSLNRVLRRFTAF
jgi:hypothetical protein